MAKTIPLEGSRLAGSGIINWHWLMPWACRGCRQYGAVEVKVDMVHRSTNADIIEKIERDHWHLYRTCPATRSDRVVGRIYRWKGATKIYLRQKDEGEEDVKDQKWPPWEE